MAPVRVEINPDVLRWARELGGFTVADIAKATGAKPERVESWETGDERPTLGQLRTIAWRLRRPSAFFLLPHIPQPDLPRPPDFRSAEDQHDPSVELRRELRSVVDRRNHYIDLVDDVPAWDPGIELHDSASAGLAARELLGITMTDQVRARDGYAALAMWIAAIEDLGVLVFQSSKFELDEARGASVYFPVLPVILLNAKDPPVARCFTVLHEFGHLLMGSGALCDVFGRQLPRVERLCNRFAAATLMPEEPFLEAHLEGSGQLDILDEASRLGRRFKVSADAAVIRLRELGQVLQSDVETVRAATLRRLQEEADEDSSPPIIPHSTIKLRDLGKTYVGAVLDAYHDDRITLTDATQYLDTKVVHIDKMEQRLLGSEGSS